MKLCRRVWTVGYYMMIQIKYVGNDDNVDDDDDVDDDAADDDGCLATLGTNTYTGPISLLRKTQTTSKIFPHTKLHQQILQSPLKRFYEVMQKGVGYYMIYGP